jgi:TPR repeat protein
VSKQQLSGDVSFDADDLQGVISAADSGNIAAIHQLGREYLLGGKLEKNYSRALELLMKAASFDYAPSISSVGAMYANGWGVSKDEQNAFKWWARAAEKGFTPAQRNLGNCYYNGLGVEQDRSKAVELYKKAAAQGDGEALTRLGWCYQDGEGVDQDPTEAKRCFESAIENGYDQAMLYLAHLYLQGKGVIKDPKTAAELYLRRAYKNDSRAQYWIASLYANGNGVPLDYELALEFATKSANAGDAAAQELVGDIYAAEEFAGQDTAAAIDWYKRAIENGRADAEEKLQTLLGSEQPSNEYECNSPAMDECVARIVTFCSIFDDLLEDEVDDHIAYSGVLSDSLRTSVTGEVFSLTGWAPQSFYALLIQDYESVEWDDDDNEILALEGEVTAIYKYGFVSLNVSENVVTCPGWHIGFDSADLETLSFTSWEGDTSKGIYLRSLQDEQNLAVSGARWDLHESVNISEHLQTIENANSWLARAYSIAKGEVDRDEVLFPDEEETDDETIATYEEDDGEGVEDQEENVGNSDLLWIVSEKSKALISLNKHVYTSFHSGSPAQKKLFNFSQAYSKAHSTSYNPEAESAFLFYDGTIFGSGKEGIVFTEHSVRALGALGAGAKHVRVVYGDILSVKLSTDKFKDKEIYIESSGHADVIVLKFIFLERSDLIILAEMLNQIVEAWNSVD